MNKAKIGNNNEPDNKTPVFFSFFFYFLTTFAP